VGKQSVASASTIFLPKYQQTNSCQDYNRYKDANHINSRIFVDGDFNVHIVPSLHLVNLDFLHCFLLSGFDCPLIASLHTLDLWFREVGASALQTKHPSLGVIESIFVNKNSLVIGKQEQPVIGYLVFSCKRGSTYFGLPINVLLIDSMIILINLVLVEFRKKGVRIILFWLSVLSLVVIMQVTY
jgi:hypothetical protein